MRLTPVTTTSITAVRWSTINPSRMSRAPTVSHGWKPNSRSAPSMLEYRVQDDSTRDAPMARTVR